MRRTATLFATAVLAAAAALTAPSAAGAAGSAPSADVPAAPAPSAGQAAGPADKCTVTPEGFGSRATCWGIDPMQTWVLAGTCVTYPSSGLPVYSQAWSSGWVTGNTTATASCPPMAFPWWIDITFGPAPPAGPVGPIVGYGNKCVGVKDGNTANGTPVQIWDCLGNTAQTWKIAVDGTVRALGKCLDVKGGNGSLGTPVQLYDCNGSGAQQWQPRSDGSLYNPMSARCLDDYAYSTTNGNQILIWDCNGAANQVWHLPA
ncbi:ricin-type beta-trefoil lectin domain protein [Kitasatospora sp. NPDC056184]|uniref:ricin-type beta-trefoil lectin domain protein n=1 Tax=Kitasatospora sp. NPDC056184 TaxID=3345738 RepID=UPI0035E3AE17